MPYYFAPQVPARLPTDAEPFAHPVRVYWEDTDAGGVVFYANYLRYFERARTEWLRSLGVQQQALRESTGAMFVVTDAAVRYRLPACLDDALSITVVVRELRPASMRISQQVRRGPDLLCEGDIRIGCVEAASLRPCRIPPDITALFS